jgi:hypothetical protein
MRKIIPFKKPVHIYLNATPAMLRRGEKKAKEARIVIPIDPEPEYRPRVVKRNVLHGILSSWGWQRTKGLSA